MIVTNGVAIMMKTKLSIMKSTITLNTLFILLFTSSFIFAQEVANDVSEVHPLLINASIPDVEVLDIDGNTVNLHKLTAQQPTMFIFYRGGWCPYCSLHLSELKQVEEEISALGWQIVAISVDRPEVLKETLTEGELTYTLLSDSPAKAIKAFGLAYEVEQDVVNRYKDAGIDFEKNSGFKHHILPAPAVYMVDTTGKIRFQYVNPNYKERIAGDVLLAAAKAYME